MMGATIRISAGSGTMSTAAAATQGKPAAGQADAFLALLSAGSAEEVLAGAGLIEEKPLRDPAASEEETSDPLAMLFPGTVIPFAAMAEEPVEEGIDPGIAGDGASSEGTDALLQWLDAAAAAEDAQSLDAAMADAAADVAVFDASAESAADTPEGTRQLMQSLNLATRDVASDLRGASPAPAAASEISPSATNPFSQTLQPQTATPASTVEHAVRQAVGTPRWAEEVGSKLLLMSTRGQNEGALSLTPEHLGPMEVRISMSQGTANVWFGAQQAETRAALTEAIPRLREMFAEAGLSLGHAGVSHEAPRQQSAESSRREFHGGVERSEASIAEPRVTVRSVTSGLLDVYA